MNAILDRLRSAGSSIMGPARLLVILKTAVAATVAWILGNLLPGELDEYAYYAPLGALIAMTPTVQSSLKSSIRIVIGVLMGLTTAWLIILAGAEGWITVPLAVGIGTLLAGIPGLDAGRDYVPLAAMFVFVAGGSDADSFTFGFAIQLALGAGLGIVLNFLIPPALNTAAAKQSIHQLRERLAACVEQFAESLDEIGEVADIADHVDSSWEELLAELDRDAEAAADDVVLAWQSRRGNVRALDPRTHVEGADAALGSIRRIIRQLHEFSEPFIADARDSRDLDAESAAEQRRIPTEICSGVAEAGRHTANLIREPAQGDRATHRALEALEQLENNIAHWQTSDVKLQQQVFVVTYALRSIVSEAQQMSL